MSLLRWVPVGLAAIAEGAWISVVAGFMDELVLRAPVLGLPAFAAVAALGVILARTVGRAAGPTRWPLVGFGLLVVAALAGILAAPEARDALAAGRLGADGALAANPGGVLLGLALLRGYGHAQLPLSDDRVGRPFVGGVLVMSLLALLRGI